MKSILKKMFLAVGKPLLFLGCTQTYTHEQIERMFAPITAKLNQAASPTPARQPHLESLLQILGTDRCTLRGEAGRGGGALRQQWRYSAA